MKYEITKEQILHVEKTATYAVSKELKEWFPEAFETVLENNKWYKHKDHTELLIYPTGEDNHGHLFGYGFDIYGKWVKINEKASINCLCNSVAKKRLVEAAESEVFEAFKNEAVKRGYKQGQELSSFIGVIQEIPPFNKFEYDTEERVLKASGAWLFKNGVWATILKDSIAKEEAEKLLNKKIV